ncbi:MAG: conjugal transfer protein TraD [Holosporaceae bacterium]|nr:conjugal transfer protein TraD [Holosporaceae bacterium]
MPVNYTNIEIKLNRLYSQKAALEHKLKRSESNFRKRRTRTLIQMGGLLELTPFPAVCDINIGDDLQIDKPDNAAVLLGILSDFVNQFPDYLSIGDLQKFKNIGKSLLRKKIKLPSSLQVLVFLS